MLVGAFSISSLPFSLTASAWVGRLGFFTIFVAAAQALLIAGFIRSATRPTGRDSLDSQQNWMRTVYPAGIFMLIFFQALLGLAGWNGSRQIGAWLLAVIVSLLTFGLIWATPRFRILNPVRAHWLTPADSGLNSIYQGFWTVYRIFGNIGQTITDVLEGEGGIMWTLLFIVLFVSLLTQGSR
jgi:hypothetical protein